MPEPYGDSDYVICVRRKRDDGFIAEPGKTRYLKVPRTENPKLGDEIKKKDWFEEVRDLADKRLAQNRLDPAGDVLIFVHGYNNDQDIVMKRHRRLQSDLWGAGFRGLVISFDWPSASSTVNYLEDRSDAAATAVELVNGGVKELVAHQSRGCKTNVHLIGHSTGAYVIREAFYQARKLGSLHRRPWQVSQVVFIGGDIASGTLADNESISKPMFERSLRITNYSNRFDTVLKVSNAKRLGLRPRVGRVGLPEVANPRCVNVDCSEYFKGIDPESQTVYGTFCHSWHIGNPVFARDLALTLHGGIDRTAIPTRQHRDGKLYLTEGSLPRHASRWLDWFTG